MENLRWDQSNHHLCHTTIYCSGRNFVDIRIICCTATLVHYTENLISVVSMHSHSIFWTLKKLLCGQWTHAKRYHKYINILWYSCRKATYSAQELQKSSVQCDVTNLQYTRVFWYQYNNKFYVMSKLMILFHIFNLFQRFSLMKNYCNTGQCKIWKEKYW